MSWLYLPESVASNSGLKRQAVSELCATLSAIATQSKSSRPACRKVRSRTPRYGTTLPPSTGVPGAALWMSSLAASRVRTSVPPGRVLASRKERVPVYGPRCSESFARFDPATCSLRMCQCSLLGDSGEYSQTYPRAGTMRTGIAYRHEPLAPLTGGIESSLWPMPTCRDHKDTGDPDMLARYEHKKRLGCSVAALTCPTPESGGSLTRQMWPTARTQMTRGTQEDRGKCNLEEVVGQSKASGQLNPTWVEWLMGFPFGWTDLGVSETRSCPRWLTGSGAASLNTGGGQDVADNNGSRLLRGPAQEQPTETGKQAQCKPVTDG